MATVSFGQKADKNLKNQLESFLKADLQGDFDVILDYSFRPMVDLIGGDSLFLVSIEGDRKVNRDAGIIKESSKAVKYNDIINNNGEFQVSVDVESVLNVASKSFRSSYQVIGFSNDQKNWKFASLMNHDQESVKIFLPNLSPEILIEEKKMILPIE
jgi:hypothetical protein